MSKQKFVKWATLLAGTAFAIASLPGCDQLTSLFGGLLGSVGA
jgi:hypothetical protein